MNKGLISKDFVFSWRYTAVQIFLSKSRFELFLRFAAVTGFKTLKVHYSPKGIYYTVYMLIRRPDCSVKAGASFPCSLEWPINAVFKCDVQ